MQDTQALPIELRRRWWGVAAVFGATFLATHFLLLVLTTPTAPTFWGLPSGILLMYLLGYARINLQHNRRGAETPILSHLGISNGLTLTRGLLYGLLAGFIAHPPSSGWWTVVPGVLYTSAALTDIADGYLARVRGETTRLGAKLDIEVDSLGILVATILAVQLGRIPDIFLVFAGLYYLFRMGLWWRAKRGLPVYEMPQSPWRRLIGGFQVGFLCVILWPVLPNTVTTLGGYVLAGPILLSFLRDWYVVSRGSNRTLKAIETSLQSMASIVPVLLRALLAGAGAIFLFELTEAPLLMTVAGVAGLFSVLVGGAGRLGALVWLAIGCAQATAVGLTELSSVVIASSLGVMLLGVGAFAVWTPSDRLLKQRLGD